MYHGYPPQMYPQSPSPGQYGNQPPRKKSTGPIMVIVLVVVLIVVGVGGYFGYRVLTSDKGASNSSTGSQGVVFEAKSGLYSLRVPKTVIKVPASADSTIPSEIDADFSPTSGKGGGIKVGVTARDLAGEPVEKIGKFVYETYVKSDQFVPAKGGKVEKQSIKVDGHDAVLVSMKTATGSGTGTEVPLYTRFYFVSSSAGGPVIYLVCDWNDGSTELSEACGGAVASMKIKG